MSESPKNWFGRIIISSIPSYKSLTMLMIYRCLWATWRNVPVSATRGPPTRTWCVPTVTRVHAAGLQPPRPALCLWPAPTAPPSPTPTTSLSTVPVAPALPADQGAVSHHQKTVSKVFSISLLYVCLCAMCSRAIPCVRQYKQCHLGSPDWREEPVLWGASWSAPR